MGDSKGGLVKRVTDLETDVQNLKTAPHPPAATGDAETAAKLKTLAENHDSLKLKFKKIVHESQDGMVNLKTADFQALKEEIIASQRNIATLSGYVHIMGKEITYLDHRTTMNAAKLMKNNIIVGGFAPLPPAPTGGLRDLPAQSTADYCSRPRCMGGGNTWHWIHKMDQR